MSLLLTPILPRGSSKRWLPAIEQTVGKSGLEACFDAADLRSYPGSGQYWNDISGKGVNFTLGTADTVQASDPTFVGTVNDLGAYFQGDGGDIFRISGGNTPFFNSMHKAGAVFSFAAWILLSDNTNANFPLFGMDGTSSASRGVDLRWNASNVLNFYVHRGAGGSPSLSQPHGGTIPENTWSFIALSIAETIGANGLSIAINDDLRTFTSTYTSPTASDATYPMELCAGGNGAGPMVNGSRMACCSFWSRKLSDTELMRLYTRTRGRFAV